MSKCGRPTDAPANYGLRRILLADVSAPTERTASSPSQVEHAKALEQFKLVVETEKEQRDREVEDLKFDAGDMWPSDVKMARGGKDPTGGQPAVPARPMLTIRTLDQPIAQIVNQARNGRFAIKVSPKTGASQKDADVRQGLIRAIEYASNAQTAYLWAYERAVVCGRGYFRVNKVWAFDDPGEDPSRPEVWDQDLKIELILNGGSVYLDPWAAALNDPAAAEWAFITEDIPESRYKREFPKSKLANADDGELLTALGDNKDEWIRPSDGNGERSFRIAERFWTEWVEREEANPQDPTQKRMVRERKVKWAKMNGIEFLDEPQEWDGKYIPIVPVLGHEKNIGGKRMWEGVVRPNMDPCRMINYVVSDDAEKKALATRSPWIGYEGQFEGHEEEWRQANTRNQPFLQVKAVTESTGQTILPLPEKNIPVYPPSVQEIGIFVNFVRSTSGVPDAALGHANSNDRSGKAIAQLQQASEQGTSNFPDNLARAVRHAGVIIMDLLPKIYDRPGRRAQIIEGEDDQQQAIVLNQPFMRTPSGPQPVSEGQLPQMGEQGAQVEHYDLSKGEYAVVVEVGKSFATRQQEERDGMLALAQVAPEMVPRYADLLVKAIGGPMAEAIAERVKPPGTDSQLPPEIQAAVTGLQQENQQLKQALETKQIEAEARFKEAELKAQSAEKIAAGSQATQIAVADVKVQAERERTFVDALEQRLGKLLELHLGSLQKQLDRQHAHESQAHSQAHDAGMAMIAAHHAKEQQDAQMAADAQSQEAVE